MARNKYCKNFKLIIVSEYNNGSTQKDICEKYSLAKSVVSRIINKFKSSGAVETLHSGGRPRKTTVRDDARIVREIKRDPTISASGIINTLNLNVSLRTVQRRACEAGLKSYRAARKPYISEKNRKARIKFAQQHVDWSTQRWKTVLFSDESKFNLKDSDGMRRVRRPKNKRLDPKYCQGTIKYGGGNIMVWGCVSGQGIGPIHHINGIMDRFQYKNILRDVMLPHAEWNMPLMWRFQHDNDPKHTSKHVRDWLERKKVEVIEWPAQSPDLNPIENLWEIVNKRVNREQVAGNKDKLFEAVQTAWYQIPKQIIDNLIDSMHRRCVAVIKNKGYAIDY